MTDTRVGSERALESRASVDGGLRIRLWIGHNPLAFVLVCLVIGYWVGRGMAPARRS